MGGYNFTGERDRNAPRKEEYTFYIAAKDSSGNYSEPSEVTIQHPGIQQLEQPDVNRFFEAFVIYMPTVLTKYSTQTVYPENSNTEEKNVLGYVIRLDRVDEDDFIEKKVPAGKTSEMVEVPAKSEWELTIGAYDSVVHPDYNPSLFEDTFSEPLAISARQLDDIVDFADDLRPVKVFEKVDDLPSLPDEDYPPGSFAYVWEDNQLYKNEDDNWKEAVNTDDLVGQISETQITDGAITTPKIYANAITADKISSGSIESDHIVSNAITAGKIEAGAIGTEELKADAIVSDKIASNEIFAHHIQVDNLSAINANVGLLEAGVIQSGNWGTGQGLQIDLDNETITAGGSSNPLFHYDGEGNATFGGELVAATGTFGSKLSAVNDSIKFIEGDHGGSLIVNEIDADVELVNIGISDDILGDTSGEINLKVVDDKYSVRLGSFGYNSAGALRLFDKNEKEGIFMTAQGPGISDGSFGGPNLSMATYDGDYIYEFISFDLSRHDSHIYVKFRNLPTSDPEINGQLFRNGTDLRISTG